MKNNILCGDSLEVLKDFEDNYFDSVVTDPPYGLAFMGKKWDYDVPQVELWKEVYRVLKPGGHILSFAGSRTYHRMAVNIEDAGFEIRDMLGWLYGSGFPKSHNIGKAVDKLQGNERETLTEIQKENLFEKEKKIESVEKSGKTSRAYQSEEQTTAGIYSKTKGNSQWEGWGTALKPAHEPIVMARKPFNTSVAENVLTHGTGGINIDECRVGTERTKTTIKDLSEAHGNKFGKSGIKYKTLGYKENPEGRFPANIIHDGSEEVLEVFEESSRFFYCAKASKAERNMGLDDYEEKQVTDGTIRSNQETARTFGANSAKRKNYHPTVKPIKLMEYLVRLVTPKEGIVLEPFAGSGTTLIACKQQGFNYIGIEREQEYCDIAEARLKGVQVQGELF
jgi:site-specific DNA-methyltransferase (adenine-specific)